MTSQRDMVRASLEAEHDHGTYCRRKAERRDGDRRDPATSVTVDRERLEKIEGLLTGSLTMYGDIRAAREEDVCEAIDFLRAILAEHDHA